MTAPLLRLKYASRFRGAISAHDVEALVKSSAARNHAAQITGVLAAVGDVFLQILEGPKSEVERTLDRIVRDPRHDRLVVLRRAEGVTSRLFPTWSMRLLNVSPEARDAVASISRGLSRYETASDEMRATLVTDLDRRVWSILSQAARIEPTRSS